jgi:hypothetical protein
MELKYDESQKKIVTTKHDRSFIITSSNWEIDNNKHFDECISTVSLLKAPDRYFVLNLYKLKKKIKNSFYIININYFLFKINLYKCNFKMPI